MAHGAPARAREPAAACAAAHAPAARRHSVPPSTTVGIMGVWMDDQPGR